jgi:hypothetical protein
VIKGSKVTSYPSGSKIAGLHVPARMLPKE